MAAIKAICYHVPGWRPWANLMSISELEPESVGLDPSRPELILDNRSGSEKRETAPSFTRDAPAERETASRG